MKIDINQIPFEGLTLTEQLNPATLDLESDIIKFSGPVTVEAHITRITNAVTVDLSLKALIHSSCSRCLGDIEVGLKKDARLSYPINEAELSIDLNPDIREEIIIDYPIKPLCRTDCLGLCPECGKNLNEGKCDCK